MAVTADCWALSATAAPTFSDDGKNGDEANRFSNASSVVFAVRELNDEEQCEALALRAHLRGLELPAETARYLQHRYPRNMRALCDIFDTLDDASFVAQRRLTVPFIKGILDGQG